MSHSLLRHHVQKKYYLRNMCRKDTERMYLSKVTKLMRSNMEKIVQNLFLMLVTLQISKKRLLNK